MNKAQRERLEELICKLDEVKDELGAISEAEQEKFDNLSENLQQSEKGQQLQQAAETLAVAVSQIEDSIGSINEVM